MREPNSKEGIMDAENCSGTGKPVALARKEPSVSAPLREYPYIRALQCNHHNHHHHHLDTYNNFKDTTFRLKGAATNKNNNNNNNNNNNYYYYHYLSSIQFTISIIVLANQ